MVTMCFPAVIRRVNKAAAHVTLTCAQAVGQKQAHAEKDRDADRWQQAGGPSRKNKADVLLLSELRNGPERGGEATPPPSATRASAAASLLPG